MATFQEEWDYLETLGDYPEENEFTEYLETLAESAAEIVGTKPNYSEE